MQLPRSADSDVNFNRLRQGARCSLAQAMISAQFFSSCLTADGLVFTANTAEWSVLDGDSCGGACDLNAAAVAVVVVAFVSAA